MKRTLYTSTIEVPYRVSLLNELTRACELTVLYEKEKSSSRNSEWEKSRNRSYSVRYLKGVNYKDEHRISFGVLREIFMKYDAIIVGCYNSPSQMLAILAMKLFRIPYILNLDGEQFVEDRGIKSKLKIFFLRGAEKYLVAGEKAAHSLSRVVSNSEIVPYYFSSLTESELAEHSLLAGSQRNDIILVVGQYFDYKGMDIALEAARMDPSLCYKFVGMGSRTEKFLKDFQGKIPSNVEIIPFLQKEELEKEYQTCAMLVLPSRQECWGLVINEAASFGTPIVSTWGSGAAVEFLADEYPQYLAKPGDAEDLLRCIELVWISKQRAKYSQYLLEKSKGYSIEQSVKAHLSALGPEGCEFR